MQEKLENKIISHRKLFQFVRQKEKIIPNFVNGTFFVSMVSNVFVRAQSCGRDWL